MIKQGLPPIFMGQQNIDYMETSNEFLEKVTFTPLRFLQILGNDYPVICKEDVKELMKLVRLETIDEALKAYLQIQNECDNCKNAMSCKCETECLYDKFKELLNKSNV